MDKLAGYCFDLLVAALADKKYFTGSLKFDILVTFVFGEYIKMYTFKDIAVEEIELYESGKLSFEKTVFLFQKLIDSGRLWKMNSHFLVQANHLIERGYVKQR